ncbi:MAG TPA: protealysin inhibitor emfourin [Chryseolinea sp.]|nr:protealysin inhibitor emfourin [Chryseolinea sp.]
MKVRFKREGGFAGATIRREAEQRDLPQEAMNALVMLQDLRTGENHSAGLRRDGYRYTIEFESNQEPVVVALREEQIPPDVAPLIRYFEAST